MQKPFFNNPTGDAKTILHVDGDGFFAGCEIAKDPSLQGKSVVVGRERGMVIAMNYIAKGFGIKRGMTLREARALAPATVFCDADHASYELFNGRMNNIIERYTPHIDRYSVDESFADITGLPLSFKMTYGEIAMDLKETLRRELGMTFSIGVAPTKVLAKIASNFKKPDGLTVIPAPDIKKFLETFPIEKVWGIGRQTAAHMSTLGISTALQFAERSEGFVTDTFSKPQHELWQELRGQSVLTLNTGKRAPYKSLMRTRTFMPPTHKKDFVLAELSRHVEVVCARAREHHLSGQMVNFFLKSQEFKYHGLSIKLSRHTNIPHELLAVLNDRLDDIYQEDTLYRAAGVTLSELRDASATQLDLFDATLRIEGLEHVYEHIDELNTRFGKTVVHLAGSTHLIDRTRTLRPKKGGKTNNDITRLGLPMIGTI